METKIFIKFFDIIFHLFVKSLCRIPVNLGQVGIEHHLDPADGIYPRFEQGFVNKRELRDSQFISFSCHNNPLARTACANVKNGFNCAYSEGAIRVSLCFGMLLQCCWRGLSSALPGAAFATHSSRSCSCQLSNNSYPTTSTRRLMNPTADARTGRKAYADCRRDCRNTGINIQRGQREVNTVALI